MFYRERNLKALDRLDPVMRERVGVLLERLQARGEDVLITDGGRTPSEQDALCRKVPKVTYVCGSDSFHVHGVAIDLVPVGLLGQVQYGATERYAAIAKVAKELGFQWGWEMWGFDRPHFQYTQGLPLAAFKSGQKLKPVYSVPTREELEQRLRVAEKAIDRASPRRRLLLTRFIKRAAQALRGV